MLKRFFDVTTALVGLLILSPVLLAAAAAVRWSSPGPILFRQERVGRNFRPFYILKFRSMRTDAPRTGPPLTRGADDPRITTVGKFLRRTKIDELPQLINVVRGDMSLVGPRPEVAKYVERYRDDYAEILVVRPGITDPASLKYRDEASLLGTVEDAEAYYLAEILPDKIAMAKDYLRRSSFGYDLAILCKTALGR